MTVKIKLGGQLLIGAIIAGGLYFGGNYALDKFGGPKIAAAVQGVVPAQSLPKAKASANDLTVSLVSFHGYAPAIVANGGSFTTVKGSIYDKLGLNLNIIIQDDIPTLATIFEAKTAQCAWRTSDFWAQEQPNLRNAKLDGKVVMVVDNTRGGDAIIAKDPSIKSVEDLADKNIALLQFTPSHGMVIDAIENSSLSGKKKASLKYVFINADEGTGGVRAAFESGKVQAAALWDPDLSLALKAGGHIVYSTKSATNLIYDVMVCDSRVLADTQGREAVKKFVTGWMDGVKAARANPDSAVKALVDTEKMFTLIDKQEGAAFIKTLFNNVMWTGLEDNARILGIVGGTNHYERVYKQFDVIYRQAGALANPNSPVINPGDSIDYSFIKDMLDGDKTAVAAAKVEVNTFTEAGAAAAKTAAVTKPVMINFDSGIAVLTQRARKVIDTEMVPFIENNGSAYIELSGNADSVGAASSNRALSRQRAAAVGDYLVKQWDINPTRLKIAGNGSDKPLCNEGNPDGMTLEECRAANRTTRVGILK
jgi:NitT/TauT family transport system substrate-binding protein